MNAEVARRVTVRAARPGDAGAIRELDGLSASSRSLLAHDLSAADRCCLVAVESQPADGEVAGDVEVAGDAEVAGDVEVAGGGEVAGDGEVVGYAAALVQLGEAAVLDLVVAPSLRGQRIGSLLFDTLLAAAEERGADAVTLEVRPDNTVSQALYRRRGFVVEGRRPSYYADGSDALIMWRRPVPAAPELDRDAADDREDR